MFLAVDQIAGVKRGQLKPVAMGDSVGRAGFYTVSAKNAAVVVDVIDLGVAFGTTHPDFLGIFGGFNINAVRRAICRTEEACYALFQTVFVTL